MSESKRDPICAMCRDVGSYGEPPKRCEFCRFAKLAANYRALADTQRSSHGSEPDETNPGAQPKERSTALTALQMLDAIDFWADDHIGEAEAEPLKEMTERVRAAISHREERSPALTGNRFIGMVVRWHRAELRGNRAEAMAMWKGLQAAAIAIDAALSHRSRPEATEDLASGRASAESPEAAGKGLRAAIEALPRVAEAHDFGYREELHKNGRFLRRDDVLRLIDDGHDGYDMGFAHGVRFADESPTGKDVSPPAAPEAQPERAVGSPQDGAEAPAPRLSIAPRKHRGPLAGLDVSQDLRAEDQGIESPPPEGEPK